VLRDFAEQHLLITYTLRVDSGAILCVSEEVDSLTNQLNVLAVSDKEFGGLAELLDLTLLVHLVGLLVVDEEVGRALATHPLVEDLLVRLLLERLAVVLLEFEGGGYEFVHSHQSV